MKEQTVNKRGWVKNAAIIFLAVMLVLTFFSNTIMNRSLPEVAAQYTSSGTITTRIRGSGPVTANDNYELILNQTRTVSEINVRVGNEVSVGDTLFTLADSNSTELESARDALHKMVLDYEKDVIRASLNGDYAKENRDIRLAREALDEARAALSDLPYSEAAIAAALIAVTYAEAVVADAEALVNDAEGDVTDAGDLIEAAKEAVRLAGYLVADITLDLSKINKDVTEAEDVYNKADNAVKQAEAAVTEAEGKLTAADNDIVSKEMAVRIAQDNVASAQSAVASAREHLNAIGDNRDDIIAGIQRNIADERAKRVPLVNDRAAAWVFHKDNYDLFEKEARADCETDLKITPSSLTDNQWLSYRTVYMLAYERKLAATDATDPRLVAFKTISKIDDDIAEIDARIAKFEQDIRDAQGSISTSDYNTRRRALDAAETALANANTDRTAASNALTKARSDRTAANNTLTAARTALTMARVPLSLANNELTAVKAKHAGIAAELEAAEAELTRLTREVPTVEAGTKPVNTALAEAKKVLEDAEKDLAEAKTEHSKQLDHKKEWEAESAKVKTMQMAYENVLFAFSEQLKTEGVQGAIAELDFGETRSQIEKKRAEIEKLESDSTGTVVTSPVNGIIKNINITPGNQTQSGVPIAVIEVVDRGYSLRLTVTAEQARKVGPGDMAEVNRGWWGWGGGEIRAILRAIRNDPQNPATSRILEFDITGDVESGTNLNIILGQRSENYEVIVPNSAIRSDTNGDFVLVVQARSSPLGNRFYATRVDVTIIASDDVNSAVTGGLSSWGDYVITTSNKPIEPGMMVRLPDNP